MAAAGDRDLWRGTSPGQRADERRQRLISSSYHIVGRHGARALTVRAVCRAAGISPRGFYESFADTDALLLATYECAVRQLLDAVTVPSESSWKRMAAADRLRALFDMAAAHLQAHPEAGRVIFREALTNDVLRTRAALTLPAVILSMREAAMGTADRTPSHSGHRHLESTFLSGALSSLFIEWTSGTSEFTRDELVTYCTNASSALLSLESPAG